MSGEPMALKVIQKIKELKFHYRKNKLLTPKLCRMICNVRIQPHIDYTFHAWYPNITEKTEKQNTNRAT